MQTIWNGFGLPASNMVWTEVFLPQSCWVLLHDMPGVVTKVTLPVTTHGVSLWTALEQVWYALDSAPGPIPPPETGTTLSDDVFCPGGVLMPSEWQLFAIPDDSLQHALYLVSQASAVTVLVTALTEIGA